MELSPDFLLSVFESFTFMIAFYITIDVWGARINERSRLTRLAIIDLHVSETMVTFATQSYTHEFAKFTDAFKRAGLSDDSTRKRKLLVERLGHSVSYASARFALFQAERIHGHPAMIIHQNNLHVIYNHLKEVYMNIEGITEKDAEQRIIDEASVAIAELDFEDKIPFNTFLQNPAQEFFRQNILLNKDRQS